MPGNYGGRAGQVTTESPLTVTGATNTNPITVTVSGSLPADFFLSGYGGNPAAPTVDISQVQGNTAANGVFVATPTGASTFTIPVAGNGAYAAGGIVQPLYLKSLLTLPVDGDSDNSASIAAWGQSSTDRSQWLAARIGQFKIAREEYFIYPDITGANWCHFTGTTTSGTAVQFLADTVSPVMSVGLGPGTVPVPGQAPNFTLGVSPTGSLGLAGQGQEIVKVRLDTTAISPQNNRIALYSAFAPPGISPTWPGSFVHVAGASVGVNTATVGVSIYGTIIGNTTPGTLWIQPVLYPLFSGAQTVALAGDTTLTVTVLRLTGMPQ